MSEPPPQKFCCVCYENCLALSLFANVSTVQTNSNKKTLEDDSHANTTCLGGASLKLFDYDCPVNVQGYDPTLGVKDYRTISSALS